MQPHLWIFGSGQRTALSARTGRRCPPAFRRPYSLPSLEVLGPPLTETLVEINLEYYFYSTAYDPNSQVAVALVVTQSLLDLLRPGHDGLSGYLRHADHVRRA